MSFIHDPETEALTKSNVVTFRLIPDEKHDKVYLGHRYLDAVSGSSASSRKNEKGYEIEAAIPWRNYKYLPEKGDLLPAELGILDADEVMGSIESSMLWHMVDGKEKPWSWKGMEQWGVIELL